jgi:hypothetical protein
VLKIYKDTIANYIQRVLNRLVGYRCAKNNVMTNEIVGFGGLNFFFKLVN